ncbi:MAG: class I SAM-dependent methyltransferase, partial [Acidobacteriota bacterium]
MAESTFSYDSVPYPSYTFPQTHPDRLSTIGSLHGLSSAHPERCRVLELGCGDGTNLLSFAYALEQSSFVGVDLSNIHINKARSAASELGLENVSFIQADLSTLTAEDLGMYDFIIAHGLFSWVPDSVRDDLLRIYSECMAPEGVGYISYNAYPGCHIREISSEIMKFAADERLDPEKRVEYGRAFLNLITESADEDSLYQSMLKIELSHIIDRSDQNIYHDDLSELNQPFYFRDFATMLGSSGLQFISEADAVSSHPGKLSPKAQQVLRSTGDDLLRREQIIDLITCRRFRCSIVCRENIELKQSATACSAKGILISSRIESTADATEIASAAGVNFIGSDGTSVTIDHPLTKAALVHLGRVYSRRVSFRDLIGEAAKFLGMIEPDAGDVARTENILDQFYYAGLISLHRYQPKFVDTVSDEPEASRFARWQLKNGSQSVTSLAGPNLVPGNSVTRAFLSLLDGQHNQAEVMK